MSINQKAEQALFYMARNNLINFAKNMIPDYYAEDFHKELAQNLMDVYKGKTKRLIVSVPPRMGKSELCSRLFPAWCLGKDPTMRFIVCSYSQPLASDLSFNCREYVKDEKYKKIFPNTQVHPKFRTKDEWKTTEGGHYIAAGVGGSITGKGADCAIVDDPHKDYEEAQSERHREKVWDWYTGTFRTRLSSDASIIIVSTRWHEEDLVGRLIDSDTADDWDYINYPAIQDDGTSLCPKRFPRKSIDQVRAEMGPKKFITEYQGQPINDENTEIDIDEFEEVDKSEVPQDKIKWVRPWDLAFTENSRWSKTASVQVGFDSNEGAFYIRSLKHGSWAWNKVKKTVCRVAEREQINVLIGAGGTQKTNFEEIAEDLKGRLPKNLLHKKPEQETKDNRIRSWFATVEASDVYLVKDGSKWSKMMYQANQFPDGDFDDIIDACAMGFDYFDDKNSGVKTGIATPVSVTKRNIHKYS